MKESGLKINCPIFLQNVSIFRHPMNFPTHHSSKCIELINLRGVRSLCRNSLAVTLIINDHRQQVNRQAPTHLTTMQRCCFPSCSPFQRAECRWSAFCILTPRNNVQFLIVTQTNALKMKCPTERRQIFANWPHPPAQRNRNKIDGSPLLINR